MRRSKDMESLHGLMVDAIREIGKMENKMVEESTKIHKEYRRLDCGVMANV